MYGDCVLVIVKDVNEEVNVLYEVVFVYSILVIICYGCKGCVWDKFFVLLFFVLYDLFICYEECRVYNCVGEIRIRISFKFEMVYYYLLCFCIGFDEDDVEVGRFVVLREVYCLFIKVYWCYFCKEFKLELDWIEFCFVLGGWMCVLCDCINCVLCIYCFN